jgi:hypothetical protein
VFAEVVAVVRHEQDVGVVQGARGGEGLDEGGHHLVDGEERAQPPLIPIVEERDLVGAEGRERLHPGRFVADVGLVKRGNARRLNVREDPVWRDAGVDGPWGAKGPVYRKKGSPELTLRSTNSMALAASTSVE